MKILVTYNIPREAFKDIPKDWEVTFPIREQLEREELIRMLPEFDVLLSIFHAHDKIDEEIIDAGKNLKLISNYGVGYNNINTKYARKKNIAVTNTPHSVCNPTAELAIGLMISAARRISECNNRIRKEKESMWGTMKNLGYSLEGKTLGIIGMGNIGKNVARKAEAFGMNIQYCNRQSIVPGYKRTTLQNLLRTSDFVSIHTPLTPKTHHLIGTSELAIMKSSAILVNTSRGAVIDEKALVAALESNCIAGAALDVFEEEPTVTETLYKMDNVVLTPHIGTGTIDTRIAMGLEAVENIRHFFEGEPTNVVN